MSRETRNQLWRNLITRSAAARDRGPQTPWAIWGLIATVIGLMLYGFIYLR